jgi:MFS transporter, FHS family, Na+ dependent glucose transporter 1
MTSPPAKQAPVRNLPIQPAARRAATAGYYASFILFGLLAAALGPTLPGLARNTGAELAQISFVFTAQALGYLMGSVYGGYLFDRLPGHRLLFGVLVGMGIMAFFVPLISLLWLLVLVFIFLGAMQGSLEVGNNTLLVWLYKDGVGPYINALHFFFGVGAVLAPIIIARTTSSSGDFYWVYWVLSLVAIPVAVWLGRLPSPTNPQLSQPGQSTRANPILVTLVAVLLFLYVGAEVSYGGWIYTYTINQFEGHPAASAALLTSAFWGALTMGRLVSIPMAARVKPATILVVDLLGCLVSLGIIMVWSYSMVAIWVGTLSLGFFMAAFFPTTVTLAGQKMQITGRVSGWFFVGAGAGGMILPWLIGQLFEAIGPGITITFIMVDLLITLGVLVFSFPCLRNLRSARRKHPNPECLFDMMRSEIDA